MERSVLVRCLVAIALVFAAMAPLRAEVGIVSDPDKWIEQALADISQGRTDEFARNYLTLIDKPNSFDSFAGNLRALVPLGAPAFMDKVVDVKYARRFARSSISRSIGGPTTCISGSPSRKT